MEKEGFKDENSLLNREIELLIDRILSSRIFNETEREDVKQNVYLKVWAASKNYIDQGKLLNWVSVITRNEAISYLRKNKKRLKALQTDNVSLNDIDSSDQVLDSRLVLLQAYDNFVTDFQSADISKVDYDVLDSFFVHFSSKRFIAKKQHISIRKVSKIISSYAQKIKRDYDEMNAELEKEGILLQ